MLPGNKFSLEAGASEKVVTPNFTPFLFLPGDRNRVRPPALETDETGDRLVVRGFSRRAFCAEMRAFWKLTLPKLSTWAEGSPATFPSAKLDSRCRYLSKQASVVHTVTEPATWER